MVVTLVTGVICNRCQAALGRGDCTWLLGLLGWLVIGDEVVHHGHDDHHGRLVVYFRLPPPRWSHWSKLLSSSDPHPDTLFTYHLEMCIYILFYYINSIFVYTCVYIYILIFFPASTLTFFLASSLTFYLVFCLAFSQHPGRDLEFRSRYGPGRVWSWQRWRGKGGGGGGERVEKELHLC